MPLVSLEIEELAEIFPELEVQKRPQHRAPLRLTFPDLSQRYLPGRGLFYSSLIHELVLVVVVLLTFQFHRTVLPRQKLLMQMIDLGDAAKITYLPTLGGGEEGAAKVARRVFRIALLRPHTRKAARGWPTQARSRSFLMRLIPLTKFKPCCIPPRRSRACSSSSCRFPTS